MIGERLPQLGVTLPPVAPPVGAFLDCSTRGPLPGRRSLDTAVGFGMIARVRD